jgi:predicted XRE-type DNA-binding protein
MSETSKPYNEIDDYIATFSDEERQEYVAAETALDLTSILYRIRQERGLTQREAAERAALQQQAISRLEKAASNIQLGSLQRYLSALGYHMEIRVIDNRTGNVAGKTSFSHP